MNDREYIDLHWHKKIDYLLNETRISRNQASIMMCVDKPSLDAFLDAEKLTFDTRNATHLKADTLLSVLAYVKRVAEVGSTSITSVIRECNAFEISTNPPPWDKVGLRNYLKICGSDGLTRSFQWIRNH